MARGIFLAAPSLNGDDVDVVATSELGRRTGSPIPFDANSGVLDVTAVGDAGDDDAHDIEIFGSQKRPYYSPLGALDSIVYTDPATFATVAGTVPVGASDKFIACAADDQMHGFDATATDLFVYLWDGSTWNLKATIAAIVADSVGGISAAAIGENVYVALADNTTGQIVLVRYNTRTFTLGLLADPFVDTTGLTVQSIALGTNGSTFVLLATIDAGGGAFDVQIYTGSVDTMVANDSTINDFFGSTWGAAGDTRACALGYNKTLGYVAAFRAGTSSPAKLRLAVSTDGADWGEFKDLNGTTRHPTTATPWATAICCGIALENRRVYIVRATAATQDTAPTGAKLQWFDGKHTWSSEVAADGGVAVDSGTTISGTNWRGAMYFGWRSSSSAATVRRCNLLTATNTGYYREIRPGEQMFIAGLDDDSRTALFFVANGSITAGDRYRIPGAEYDYAVTNVLDDFMFKVWRGADSAEQALTFDAGSGLAFLVDSIAVFGSNLPSLTVEMDDSPSFASPSISQAVLATVETATVASVDRNRIAFAADTFEARRFTGGLAKYWVRLSGGTGGVFRIIDNTDAELIVDGSAAGASGTATIFRDSMGYLFSSIQTPKRYMRIVTPTLELPDEYYQISRVVFGLRFVPGVDYRIEWQRRYGQQQARTELKNGARFNTLLNFTQRPAWTLKFRHYLTTVKTIANFFGLAQGGVGLFAFWPDAAALSGDQPEVFPMFFTTDAPEVQHIPPDAGELSCVIEGQI